MEMVAAGFWGAFFGTVALMLAASLAAFIRSLHRVALTAALSALISAVFAVAYLGWLPIEDPRAETRMLAHVATLCSTVLALMLLAMLGLMRQPRAARAIRAQMLCLAGSVLLAGWLLSPYASLVLSSVVTFTLGAAGLAVCLRSALRGDRLAWPAVAGISFMLVAIAGLSWIALHRREVAWQVHAVSAVAGMAYLSTIAVVLWARYAWLIELRDVMAHGPSYDPVTRMRSHAETGQMVGAAFFRDGKETRPVGVIVVSLGNLYALEQLHGRAAVNHALFICASRLRRTVPADVETGRLADDGFLLMMRNCDGAQRLVQLSQQIAQRLARPVALSNGGSAGDQAGDIHWVADVGVGLLHAPPHTRPAHAVSLTRAMSRTAWSYASRVAWFDDAAGQIAELPPRALIDAALRVKHR